MYFYLIKFNAFEAFSCAMHNTVGILSEGACNAEKLGTIDKCSAPVT